MRRFLGFFLVFTLMSSFPLQGQEASSEAHGRLGIWVGDWTYVVGEGSGTYRCEWLGDFWVECDEVYTNGAGTTVELLGVWGYDPGEGAYTWQRYWGDGSSDVFKGSIDGDTWTFVSEEQDGLRHRFVLTEESSDGLPFFWEQSPDGGPWEHSADGKMTRLR